MAAIALAGAPGPRGGKEAFIVISMIMSLSMLHKHKYVVHQTESKKTTPMSLSLRPGVLTRAR